jgi:transposase-like protein
MALVHVQCPQCQRIDVVQYGKQANGTQRYHCNNPNCQRTIFLLHLLYAPLTIPLVYCPINSFQRATSLARPSQGGEKRTAVWASHHEEL